MLLEVAVVVHVGAVVTAAEFSLFTNPLYLKVNVGLSAPYGREASSAVTVRVAAVTLMVTVAVWLVYVLVSAGVNVTDRFRVPAARRVSVAGS